MKNKAVYPILIILLLLYLPSWAENENTITPIEKLDYIVLDATLQNFDAKPEVDGLKVRIYYINRDRDEAISWVWRNTDVIYTIFKSGAYKNAKDRQILSGYERISNSSDLVYIRLSPTEQSYGNGLLLVTVNFPNGRSFSATRKINLSP